MGQMCVTDASTTQDTPRALPVRDLPISQDQMTKWSLFQSSSLVKGYTDLHDA